QICLDIQSLVNEVDESHSATKRKLADVTNQLGSVPQARKRRARGNRAAGAPKDVENPATLEDRVRKAGRHFVIEYGLFLFTDVHTLLATKEDPTFKEETEFSSKASRIQGQLRDFLDGMNNQRSTMHSRLRHESLALIVSNLTFCDGEKANIDCSSSRFNAFAKRIGYQPATADAAAFYSILKAEVLYDDYDGTMNIDKIYRNRLPMMLYACIIRGPQGANGLFDGNSKLPAAKVTQRIYDIQHSTAPAIAASNTWLQAVWYLSADTQLGSGGEGDETQIDYTLYYETILRQICEGLRTKADWALDLFRCWDDVLF
ncbi:hypothetical protein C8R46DRAFT_829024, partial [Mycena filopes]